MATSVPAWFDQDFYLAEKAAYNNSHSVSGITNWTAASVLAGFTAAGMTAYQHYTTYGVSEGLSPDRYFNVDQYETSKVAQLNSGTGYNGKTTWTKAEFAAAVGGDVFSHYLNYGAFEANVEPSSGFNDDDYYTAKATYNSAHSVGGSTSWSAAQVRSAFAAAGLSPIQHYLQYGQAEGFYTPTAQQVTGLSYTLTTGQDIINGDYSSMTIRGIAGLTVGAQDQSTLNSSDQLIDPFTTDNDKLVVNMTGYVYNGGATITNIETIQVGTDLAATAANTAVVFDLNVNQGAYEVTGAKTLEYDQITSGEVLLFRNIVPTDANATVKVAPTLWWANENGSTPGTAATTYRAVTVAGTTDNQAVKLTNINAGTTPTNNGVLLIAGGMETITITSDGAIARNTLNNVQDFTDATGVGAVGTLLGTTYGDTGTNSTWADVVSSGSLTSVVLNGATAIGKKAGVITEATDANLGLTNRFYVASTVAADGDLGLTASRARSSAANLLSVDSRVTSIDATGMTADTALRFTAKSDGVTATNVTFLGGSGNDYVEFELGNVNATGGAGNDTFSFINTGANSTFGEGDTLAGGDGTDTIQLGVNGAGTYTVGQTELRNKTGIGVIDLRGATNSLTLSSDFVAAGDVANRMEIHTDRIVQSSDTDASNPLNGANNGLETTSTDTVNLTTLTSSQGVTYVGGSGSDRLILNDATFNILQVINGGAYNDTAVIGAGRFNTITLTTTGEAVVIDSNDLSNVSNVQGFVLTKGTAAATYNITLTQAFVNNNTQASNNANTTIDDTIFDIGTSAAANQSMLGGGDTVTIDVRNLLNATDTGRATGFTVRTVDITSLTNAGVTVTFVGNTGNLTLAQVTAAGIIGTDAARNDVIVSSAANPGSTTGNLLTFTGTEGNTTTGFEIQGGKVATALSDTINVGSYVLAGTAVINGAGGTDTLVMANGANIAAATFSTATAGQVYNLTLDTANPTSVLMTQAEHAAILGTVSALGANDTITITGAGAVSAFAGIENYAVSSTGADQVTVNAATLGVNIAGAAANVTTVNVGGLTVTGTYGLLNAADVLVATDGANIAGVNSGALTTAEGLTLTGMITMTSAQYNGLTITAAGAADGVTLTTSGTQTAQDAVERYVLQGTGAEAITFGGADAVRGVQSVDLTGSTGADVVTINNAGIAAGSNYLTITGFSATTDKFALQVGGTSTDTGTFNLNYTSGALTVSTGDVVAINGNSVQFSTATAPATVLAWLNTAGVVGSGAGQMVSVVAYDGLGHALLYQATETAAGATAVELIGVTNAATNSLGAFNFA